MTAGVLVAIVAYVGVGLGVRLALDRVREGPLPADPNHVVFAWPITVATIIAGIFVLWVVRQETP